MSEIQVIARMPADISEWVRERQLAVVVSHLPGWCIFPVSAPIELQDGTQISAQASAGHYCLPRKHPYDVSAYTHVEVCLLGSPVPEYLEEYCDGDDVCGYVPVVLLARYIFEHGGLKR